MVERNAAHEASQPSEKRQLLTPHDDDTHQTEELDVSQSLDATSLDATPVAAAACLSPILQEADAEEEEKQRPTPTDSQLARELAAQEHAESLQRAVQAREDEFLARRISEREEADDAAQIREDARLAQALQKQEEAQQRLRQQRQQPEADERQDASHWRDQ